MEDQVKQLLSLGKSGILVSWIIQDLINRICTLCNIDHDIYYTTKTQSFLFFILDHVEGWCEHGTLIRHNNNDGILFEWII